MQNDVLKNNIAPWQEKGRWYHFKMIDGIIVDSLSDPIQYLRSTSYLYLPGKVCVCCVPVVKPNPTLSSATNITSTQIRIAVDGSVGVVLGAAATLERSEIDLYIFAIDI